MRISDWSADVCSSDLADAQGQGEHRALEAAVDLFEGRALAGPSASQQRVRDLDREARGAAGYGGGRGGGGKGFDQHSPAWMPWRAKASQAAATGLPATYRSEEHTSELQSLMRISYAVFCLKKTHN